MPSPTLSSRHRGIGATCATLGVLVALTGCAGDPQPRPGPPPERSAGEAPAVVALPTTVGMGRVTGRLGTSEKRRVKQQAGRVVDQWFDAAYVAGAYPRTRFPDAYAGFTPGARRRALADRDLTSNAVVGSRTTQVVARRREAKLDVLGVAGRPVAVTARFVLALDRTRRDGVVRRERVAGRLLMTRAGAGRWKVFAYDVTRGGAR